MMSLRSPTRPGLLPLQRAPTLDPSAVATAMNAPAKKTQRDSTYDVLRGLAIVTMLCANVIGYVTPSAAHPLWLRVYGSFAAPLFIALAGLVASLGIRSKGHGFGYFFKRGALIIATAALIIDVAIWQILPFTTYDVLYLIGFSFMVLFYFEKMSLAPRIAVTVAVVVATPLLQRYLGYTDLPTEYDLNGKLTMEIAHPTPIWQHWLLDGWFPVFPWIAFAFMGGLMLDAKAKLGSYRDRRFVLGSLALFAAGNALFWRLSFAAVEVDRGAYSEIFYPPTVGYVLIAAGLFGLLAAAVEKHAGHAAFFPLRVMGQASMFIYILHTALVQFFVLPRFADPKTEEATGSLNASFVVYGLMTAVCLLASLGLHFLKKKWKPKNFIVRFYIGS